MSIEVETTGTISCKANIVKATRAIVKFGGNPFHVRRGAPQCTNDLVPVTLLSMLLTETGEDDAPWESHKCLDVGFYLQMALEIIVDNANTKYLMQLPLVQCFILNLDGSRKMFSHLDLIIICGKFKLYELIRKKIQFELSSDNMDLAVYIYNTVGLPAHKKFVTQFYCVENLMLQRYPLPYKLEFSDVVCRFRTKHERGADTLIAPWDCLGKKTNRVSKHILRK